MNSETGASHYERRRSGYAALAVGLFILLSAWVIAVNRAPPGASVVAQSRDGAATGQKLDPPDRNRILPAMGTGMLIWGAVLLFIFVVSTFAFIRVSRHYRRLLLHKPADPTPTADVWKMHKTPPLDTDPDGGGPSASEES
ncbi:MAG: hypothetical protein HOP29_14575 [Phycisphaerales bacterium]|nr:hypothetical protein [Phycisphaerales bacterium]